MTVDTKGFLVTNKKDVFKIYEIIKKAITDDMLLVSGEERLITLYWNKKSGFSAPSAELHEVGMVIVNFTYKKEKRSLHFFVDCDSDYSYVRKGKKIILSLGAWGSSVHLMEVCLKALQKELGGKAYMIDDDCSDDWRKL